MEVIKMLVPHSIASKVTNGRKNTKRKICIHETGNKNKGADALAHAKLQLKGNSRNASWHYQTCDKEVIQSFTHDYQCRAAGTANGNNEAIQIEICVNSDGDYKKAVQNAVLLCAKICKEEGLTANDLVQHNYYSGKNCPEQMRKVTAPIPWHAFVQMVKSNLQPKAKKEEVLVLLNKTGREEIRQLLVKARSAGIIDKAFHTDEKIKKYTDIELLSYQAAVVNRTFK